MRITRLVIIMFAITHLNAQVGDLIWEDEFNTMDNWMAETGNGSWGWGNGELQFYQAENVDIAPVPNEPGNNALRITAKAESGSGITDQWGNPLNYTSARVTTRAKVSVQYGMIEMRVKVPDIELGGWPAVWLLGTSNLSWPYSGEIDMMEMGSSQAFRDLHDAHNGGNGLNNSTVNQVVGANAIFYADEALTPENPTGAASISWDPDDDYCRPYYNHSNPLIDRFLIYRTYWDADSLRFAVVDNGVEHDLFTEAFLIDSISSEFHKPFYFIANLAIGGAFTDVYQLGDPASGEPVSLPLPAEMYVDYIRVYEWNGQGSVHLGPPTPKYESYGLFTDNTPTASSVILGSEAEIYVWEETLISGTIPPLEGDNGISWQTNGKGWFGAGIMTMQPLNMSNFGDGSLNFSIKIPGNVSFQVGIIDTWGNQSYLEFPANTTSYGLIRNGQWGQASIPISEIRGEFIDLRMLSYAFVILEVSGTACELALDDIYWTGGTVDIDQTITDYYPEAFKLLQNYPNPFNPTTRISYELPAVSDVTISVYDVTGRLIRGLTDREQPAGYYDVQWNGLDDSGNQVGTGVYLCRLDAGDYSNTIKMVLLR